MTRHVAPLVAAALVLIWHTLQYNFVTDDAYISFVYARNLAEHGALVFNASDLANPVEGYTNFLWTAILGVLMWLGISPEVSSLVLGAAFAMATMVIAFRLAEELLTNDGTEQGDQDNPIAGLAPALLASCAGFACWASGGLETQLFAFLIVLALFFVVRSESSPRSFRWVGIAMALAAMTRPEGLLCVGVIAVFRLATNIVRERRLIPSRDELSAAGWFVGLWLPWFLWRFWYYGHVFPNTYYVKAAGKATDAYLAKVHDNGMHYVWTWAKQSGAVYLSPLIVLGALAHRRSSRGFRFGVLALVLSAVYLIYAVRVGGDFMGLHRFVMPATILSLLLASLGVERVARFLGRFAPTRMPLISAALAATLFAVFAFYQLRVTRTALTTLPADNGIDTPAYLDLYARDRAKIGAHMRSCFREGDFSIFGGVGAKPFYARAEGIDVFGLVSTRIAHEVARTKARAGHSKWGPDKLLLEHDPDFIFSCYSLHRKPAPPALGCGFFWKRNGYEQITLHIPGLKERGEYYTFFAKKERQFDCPGRLP